MAKFELKLPKMGESVAEATITSWLKEVGDTIEADEAVLEIATDKVDSEVPSEVDGVLVEKLFDIDDVVQVGQTIAVIETEADDVPVATPVADVKPELLGGGNAEGDRLRRVDPAASRPKTGVPSLASGSAACGLTLPRQARRRPA